MNKQSIKKILDYQNYFMHDKKLRYKYELQEKAIRDYNSSMLAVRDESKQEDFQKKVSKKKKYVQQLIF